MGIFLDTGIFFGAYSLKDRMHEDAKGIYLSAFRGKWGMIYTSDYIIDETCTLLKVKTDPGLSLQFLKAIRESRGISIVIIDEKIFCKSCEIYETHYKKRGLSFTDATCISIMKEVGIEFLASFDGRSFDGIVDERIGEGIWSSLSEEEKKEIEDRSISGR